MKVFFFILPSFVLGSLSLASSETATDCEKKRRDEEERKRLEASSPDCARQRLVDEAHRKRQAEDAIGEDGHSNVFFKHRVTRAEQKRETEKATAQEQKSEMDKAAAAAGQGLDDQPNDQGQATSSQKSEEEMFFEKKYSVQQQATNKVEMFKPLLEYFVRDIVYCQKQVDQLIGNASRLVPTIEVMKKTLRVDNQLNQDKSNLEMAVTAALKDLRQLASNVDLPVTQGLLFEFQALQVGKQSKDPLPEAGPLVKNAEVPAPLVKDAKVPAVGRQYFAEDQGTRMKAIGWQWLDALVSYLAP